LPRLRRPRAEGRVCRCHGCGADSGIPRGPEQCEAGRRRSWFADAPPSAGGATETASDAPGALGRSVLAAAPPAHPERRRLGTAGQRPPLWGCIQGTQRRRARPLCRAPHLRSLPRGAAGADAESRPGYAGRKPRTLRRPRQPWAQRRSRSSFCPERRVPHRGGRCAAARAAEPRIVWVVLLAGVERLWEAST